MVERETSQWLRGRPLLEALLWTLVTSGLHSRESHALREANGEVS